MQPSEILRIQEKKIDKLGARLYKQTEKLDDAISSLKAVQGQAALADKRLKELALGHSFRKLMERVAEQVIPFHYIVEIPLPGAAATRIPQPLQTTTKGWFFADRVYGSYRPTAGTYANQWRPLTHSDPAIAVQQIAGGGANPVQDVIDFVWDYSENRTNMARQNDSKRIPGDLLFRRDQDGLLLGGDPWAPRSTITPALTPLNAPTNDGVFVFTFLGSLCLNTPESAVQSWMERKSILGL